MKKSVFIVLIILLLNSCATVFNKKTTSVNITTDKESQLIYNSDTITINKERIKIHPIRSKKPLEFTILKDSLKENFSLKRKTSFLFWLNLNYTYGLGMLVDFTNDKRFTYKHNLHFITDSISNKIVLSNKKITRLPKNTLFLYTSPLQAIDVFSMPALTLGAEYFIKDNISLSAEYGIKYTNIPNQDYNISYLKNKGLLYRLETKWYNGINLTNNVHSNEYLGIELRVIKNQYNDYINYSERNNSPNEYNYITDDFATKKNVTIVNLKYGLIVLLGKKTYLDFYSGFGVRVKKFNHLNLEYDKSIHRLDFPDDFALFDYRDFKNYNKKSFFNYSLGCKFGIKL
ncbi:hypothetical protein [Thalassobellus citreus]|uniref:hypothetical protein n=1 Tax=Thalassobellus citreus TaxID=3367752 RepID=UPI0037AB1B3C